MSKMRKESTDDPEFPWWEEELKAIRIQLSAAATTAQTALVISSANDATALDLVAGDVLLVEENPAAGAYGFEVVEVTTTPTSSIALVVTRGAANTSANTATIASSAYLLKIGSASRKAQVRRTARLVTRRNTATIVRSSRLRMI